MVKVNYNLFYVCAVQNARASEGVSVQSRPGEHFRRQDSILFYAGHGCPKRKVFGTFHDAEGTPGRSWQFLIILLNSNWILHSTGCKIHQESIRF